MRGRGNVSSEALLSSFGAVKSAQDLVHHTLLRAFSALQMGLQIMHPQGFKIGTRSMFWLSAILPPLPHSGRTEGLSSFATLVL